MHALNRVTAFHAERSDNVDVLNNLTLGKLFTVEKYWDRFCDAVCAEAMSDVAAAATSAGAGVNHHAQYTAYSQAES